MRLGVPTGEGGKMAEQMVALGGGSLDVAEIQEMIHNGSISFDQRVLRFHSQIPMFEGL